MAPFMLDPQARAWLVKAKLQRARPVSSLPPEEARKAYSESRLPTQPVPQPVAAWRDFFVPSLAGLVPEHRFPAAIDEANTAVRLCADWLKQQL